MNGNVELDQDAYCGIYGVIYFVASRRLSGITDAVLSSNFVGLGQPREKNPDGHFLKLEAYNQLLLEELKPA